MDQARLALLFNEWMRRYTDEPERYEAEFATVKAFLADESAGVEPNYGKTCAAYFAQLDAEVK